MLQMLQELLNIKNVYIKDEARNPTASFKDRASAVGVAKAIERNDVKSAQAAVSKPEKIKPELDLLIRYLEEQKQKS